MTKIIYLDQNKWIDLSRAYYNTKGGEQFKDVLDLLSKKVVAGEVILPMSIVHYIETTRSANPDRKEKFARFMVSLTKENGIVPFNHIRNAEVNEAVLKRLGRKAEVNVKDLAIGTGLKFIFAIDLLPGIPDEIKNILDSDETLIKLLLLSEKELSLQLQKESEDALEEQERLRESQKDESKEMRLRLIIADMSQNVNPIIINCLKQLNEDVKMFVDGFKSADDWKSFFFDIPTMDIWMNLHHLRNNDKSKKIHRNDTNDIAFLSIAVPYCDIVVCEKYWAHLLNSSGLAFKYNCIVLDSLNDLKTHI
jgi:hypothetical protein